MAFSKSAFGMGLGLTGVVVFAGGWAATIGVGLAG